MIHVAERRQRPRRTSTRDGGSPRRASQALRDAGLRAWEGTVLAFTAAAMLAAAGAFLMMGAAARLRESKLPAWLLGGAGLLAAFLLWRSTLAGRP